MRRVTSIVSASLNAAGARRSELSRTRPTSAILREGRLPVPEKITSSMPDARMFLYELSPITQRNASSRLDLPQPFGPTTPVNPNSILKSVGSQKLLKPARRSRSNFMGFALFHPFSLRRRGARRRAPSAVSADLASTPRRRTLAPRRHKEHARSRPEAEKPVRNRPISTAAQGLCRDRRSTARRPFSVR